MEKSVRMKCVSALNLFVSMQSIPSVFCHLWENLLAWKVSAVEHQWYAWSVNGVRSSRQRWAHLMPKQNPHRWQTLLVIHEFYSPAFACAMHLIASLLRSIYQCRPLSSVIWTGMETYILISSHVDGRSITGSHRCWKTILKGRRFLDWQHKWLSGSVVRIIGGLAAIE